MSARPPRQRPGGPSPITPSVQPIIVGAPAPNVATGEALRVPLSDLARNPLNRRDVHANPAAIAAFAQRLLQVGQMKACTVVTQDAFVAIFPELAEKVGGVKFVQVDGERRRAGVELAGIGHLAVTVDDGYASDRLRFIQATVAENLDREDLNPLEEAEQIAVLVGEVGTQSAAADELRKTGAWVTQRLNLLKLVPDVQAAVRAGEIPVAEVRELHRATPAEQLAALQAWRRKMADRERREQPGSEPAGPRPSRATAPFHRFTVNRPAVVAKLRAELDEAGRRAMAAEFQAAAEDLLRDE